MIIEIFGTGCPRCKDTERNVNEALNYLSLKAELVKVGDPRILADRGILHTPGVAINGELKCTGRIPETRELHNWITTAAIKEDTK
jgi:small redox-active disulfide protein 2